MAALPHTRPTSWNPDQQRAMTEFPEGTRVAIPHPWKPSLSGCAEWVLVGWTEEDDDDGLHLPILDDGYEGPQAWGDDFALRDPRTGEWHFVDGERCDDENLVPTFRHRRHRD